MNDRELLELAAKAAGIDLHVEWNGFGSPTGRYRNGATGDTWNPLEDDGDALRLAVKLQIDLRPSLRGRVRFAYAQVGGDMFAESGDDLYAATRRAIVRAAAQIGKEMK
jgi:hypothetical protein